MSQFEVFENPIPAARRAFPFVAVLQSDLADTGRDRIVAPLVPRGRIRGVAGTLTPVVKVDGVEHVLLVPRLTPVSSRDLRGTKDELTSHRDKIVDALDLLFLGV